MNDCFEIAVTLHALTPDRRQQVVEAFGLLAGLLDDRALLAWQECDEGCMNCRPAVKDLDCVTQTVKGGDDGR